MLQKCETRQMRVMHTKAGNGLKKVARLGNLWVDFDGSIVGDRIHD